MLNNKTIIITGASRGIGREMALKFAKHGANVVIAAKSVEPHPKLPGTIYSVAEEVDAAGGTSLPVQLDVRDDDSIQDMIRQTVERFGGIDVVINNAGAIKLAGAASVPMKRFDLMYQINTRAVLACSQAALPWLKKSSNAHILNLSPPINLNPKWFAHYGPYTTTKYGMSMLTLGLAEEFKRYGIAVNSLWPQTVISTAAIEFEGGGKSTMSKGRKPAIMADAAFEIISTENQLMTGQHLIDEKILKEKGVSDFEKYRYDERSNQPLMTDLFID
jgi:citronellol/citronellal dehydrogenase